LSSAPCSIQSRKLVDQVTSIWIARKHASRIRSLGISTRFFLALPADKTRAQWKASIGCVAPNKCTRLIENRLNLTCKTNVGVKSNLNGFHISDCKTVSSPESNYPDCVGYSRGKCLSIKNNPISCLSGRTYDDKGCGGVLPHDLVVRDVSRTRTIDCAVSNVT
jgi:hypothetical protein